MSEETRRCSIVVFSGDMDKVFAAFIIGTTAAAMGMETTMFFTFWGLKAIQKGTPTGNGFFGKMMGVMNRGGSIGLGHPSSTLAGLAAGCSKR